MALFAMHKYDSGLKMDRQRLIKFFTFHSNLSIKSMVHKRQTADLNGSYITLDKSKVK